MPCQVWILHHIGIASVWVFFGVFMLHRLVVTVYRLVFSPLARFPGPRLAGASSLYEFYFNFCKNGKYVFELSICDPTFYDKLYVSGSVRPTESYNRFADGVDFDGSHFLTISHGLHRVRRKPFEPYFSRLGVTQLEPTIHELMDKLLGRFDILNGTNTVVRLDHVLTCFTGDVISRICCDSPTDLIDDEQFSADWHEALNTIVRSMPLFESFPWLIRVVRLVPKAFLTWLDPRSQLFNDWKEMAEQQVQQIKDERSDAAKTRTHITGPKVTLLRHLIHNSGLPEIELSTSRLVNETQVLLGAGTIGTARVLDLICYYILARSEVRARVISELNTVMVEYPQRKPTLSQLERCVYFQAVIKEGLRLSYGVMRRLPRVSPSVAIQFRRWTIPPGVPVGMSAYMQLMDPEIFFTPFEFISERWLPGHVTTQMHRNFVPFSKGSRNCLGMNLAYAEMNHVLAALFRPEEPRFQLFETEESDITLAHDFVVPLPRVDSKGLRVVIQ
ncbi:cytochrome P450 [Amniculicola lignicola CBS 123094]|uniref:Cytochrome P450 n=1 Tax=Amniculicola lignicola CBS 123094 TaxID=1392246 RepID=A0A6A5WRH6_9PLEO|nr:cytochrome P450 [Amniculicola lignicola CBS 123094]